MATKAFSGGDKLEALLKEMSAKVSKKDTLSVGFLEGSTYPDGTPTPMIAAIQEFGAPAKGIPPRPFFRTMVSSKSSGWGDLLAKELLTTNYDGEKALKGTGAVIASELQTSIIDTTAPALSPVTLLLRERFGSNPQEITFADVQKAREDIASGKVPNVTGTQSHPLIWTSHLLNSVDYEVKS